MNHYSVLIVDDEPNARDYLKELVERQDSVELIGICNTGNEALEFCKTLQPDIIFMDIQMPGKDGIATARKLIASKISSVIVFTTAYDQYAIQAFEVEAIGYLLKPFSEQQFLQHLNRAILMRETKQKADFSKRLNLLFKRFSKPSNTKLSELLLKEKGLEIRIPTHDIRYLVSDSEYVIIFTSKRKYLKRLALKTIGNQLPATFIRIHRSIIINKDHIFEWKYLNNGTYTFKFKNGESLISSRTYQSGIKLAISGC